MQARTYKGRYKVEYSVVNLTNLEGAKRIDAEYYDPEYLRREKIIEKKNFEILKNIASNYYRTFEPKCDYFNYIEIANVNLETGEYIIEEIPCKNAPSRAKKIVNKDDIIISTVRPNRNAVAIIYSKIKNLVASTGFCKLTAKKINPKYIYVLFKTYIYRDFLARKTTATMYPAVSEDDIINLKIPIPSNNFQKRIEKFVLKAHEEREKAEQFYKEAEEILLEELGMNDWKPKTKNFIIGGVRFEEEKNISIKKLSNIQDADRLDAEFWLPNYGEIEGKIKKYLNEWDYLTNLLGISKEKISPKSDEIYNYIELSDINSNLGSVNQTQEIIGSDLPSRAKMKIKKGDVLMSSVEGSIDKIALIDLEKKNLVASTGFFVFQEDKLNKETILVLLKLLSKIYIKRQSQGTILTAIPYDSLSRVILPIIKSSIQSQISEKIQQSFKARRKSKQLLEIAKKTVEIFIKKNEKEGLKFIFNQLKHTK